MKITSSCSLAVSIIIKTGAITCMEKEENKTIADDRAVIVLQTLYNLLMLLQQILDFLHHLYDKKRHLLHASTGASMSYCFFVFSTQGRFRPRLHVFGENATLLLLFGCSST